MKEKLKILQIGKFGITENVLGEIKTQLKDHRKVKIKLLKSAKGEKSSKEIAEQVAAHVNAELLDARGNTFILAKK